MALVNSQAKRSSRTVSRTLVWNLPRVVLLATFVVLVVVLGIPAVKIVTESAKLAQENKMLESRIAEMRLQIEQLRELQSLLLAKYEVLRTKEDGR